MANVGGRLCRIASSYGLKMKPRLLQRSQSLETGRRYLFDSDLIGLTSFKRQAFYRREILLPVLDQFKAEMTKARAEDEAVRTDDLTSVIFLCDSTEDLDLVKAMVYNYSEQHKTAENKYVYGPVLMRRLHILNQPELAFELFMDERLQGEFVHDASIRALTDLLYENQMYTQVLQVFDQFLTQRRNYSLRPDLQAMHHAASLRVNTPESLDGVVKVQEESKTSFYRSALYASLLALKQEKHGLVENFMSGRKIGHVKAMQNCMMGDAASAVSYLEFHASKHVPTFPDLVDDIEEAVKKSADSSLEERFNTAKNSLVETGNLKETSLEEHYLTLPITYEMIKKLESQASQTISQSGVQNF